jgi:hypothetical protein
VVRRGIPAVAILALVLCSCSGNTGLDLARQACSLVHQSIKAYDAGSHSSDHAVRARDFEAATVDLQRAEPIAASATSADGQWNALMTTLNEIGQVDEGHLITALRAQCAVADSNQESLQGLASTTSRRSNSVT